MSSWFCTNRRSYPGNFVFEDRRYSKMAIYYCRGCNRCLNLNDEFLFPPNAYFEAGNKGTVSFWAVDNTDFRQKEQNKCFPFFETLDHWGFRRRRTKLTCAACGNRLGYIYDDVPSEHGIGQGGFGYSQVVPRRLRYRMKRKAIRISGYFNSKRV
ncbi:uncharacterized protein At4g08330, chloroplastic isoform X1 [Physcomitrium patens]|nr:uncharacterized protein LOC112279384 isoform X1 [Physcomitrium patens]|eukprot:XP_024369543.1 uncharacterized protein LOC112279384 isoform X1 [Physcomitrella patens]